MLEEAATLGLNLEEEGKGKTGEDDEKHLGKCRVLEWRAERLRFSQGDRAVEGLKPGRCWADKGPRELESSRWNGDFLSAIP